MAEIDVKFMKASKPIHADNAKKSSAGKKTVKKPTVKKGK